MAANSFILDPIIQDRIKAYIKGNIDNGTAKDLGIQGSRLLEDVIEGSIRRTAKDIFPENLKGILRAKAEVAFQHIQNTSDPRFFSQFNMESNIKDIRSAIEALFIDQVINQDGKLEGQLKPEYKLMLDEQDPNGEIFQAREIEGKPFTREQWFAHCLVNSYLSCCKHYFGHRVARKVDPQTAPMSLVQNISLWQHPDPAMIQYVMELNPVPADASTFESTPVLSRFQSAPAVGSSASSTGTPQGSLRRRSLNLSQKASSSANIRPFSPSVSDPMVGSSSSSAHTPFSLHSASAPLSENTPTVENEWPRICQRMPAGASQNIQLKPGVMYIKHFATGRLMCSYIDADGQRISMRVSKDNVDGLSVEARAQLAQIETSEPDVPFPADILLTELLAINSPRITSKEIRHAEQLEVRSFDQFNDNPSEKKKDKKIKEKTYSSRRTKPKRPYEHNLANDVPDSAIKAFIPSLQKNLEQAYFTLKKKAVTTPELENLVTAEALAQLQRDHQIDQLTGGKQLKQARKLASEFERLRSGRLTEKEQLELIRLRSGTLTNEERLEVQEKIRRESARLKQNGVLTEEEHVVRARLLQKLNHSELTEKEQVKLVRLLGKMTEQQLLIRTRLLQSDKFTETALLQQAAAELLKLAAAEPLEREALLQRVRLTWPELFEQAERLERAQLTQLAKLLCNGRLTMEELLVLEANLRIDAGEDPIVDLELAVEREPIRIAQRELQKSVIDDLDIISAALYRESGDSIVLQPALMAFQVAIENNDLSSLTWKELQEIKTRLSFLRDQYIAFNNKERSEFGKKALQHASFQSDIENLSELLHIVDMAMAMNLQSSQMPQRSFISSLTSVFSSDTEVDAKWQLKTNAEWKRDYETLDEKIIQRWEKENKVLYSQYIKIGKGEDIAEENDTKDAPPRQELAEKCDTNVGKDPSAPTEPQNETKIEETPSAPIVKRSGSSWESYLATLEAEDQHQVLPAPKKKETEAPDSEFGTQIDIDSELGALPPLTPESPLPVDPGTSALVSGSSTTTWGTPVNFYSADRSREPISSNVPKVNPSSELPSPNG